MYGITGMGMFSGWLLMALFWFTVIMLVIWGLRVLLVNEHSPSTREIPSTPLNIAQQRYAKGELSREEYLALVQDISQTQ